MKILSKALFFLFTLFFFATTNAGQEDKMNGWAWSSNVGWISFNCTNTISCGTVDYGVDVDSFGNLSGYAWSSNVGWVDFSGTSYDSSTGALSGDANFLSADEESDGWDDGTLRLSDNIPVSYGPILNSTTDIFEGYAWGSDVVGWVDFNTSYGSVVLDPFSFVFTADKGLSPGDEVSTGGDVTLSWTTDGTVTSCVASNGTGTTWTDTSTKSASGSEIVSGLITDTTFSLTCFNGEGKSITRNILIYVSNPEPSIIFTADDYNIRSGEDAVLNWTVQYADSCSAYGSWSGSKNSTSGTENISGLTNLNNVFELRCTSIYPEYPGTYSAFLTIQVDLLIINLERVVNDGSDPRYGRYGEPVEIGYLVENPNNCVVAEDFLTVGSFASSSLTMLDYSLGELAGGGADGLYITASTSTTDFDSSHGDVQFTFNTEPLFTDNEDSKRIYRFQMSCTGPNDQSATSTINISIGRNPSFDER
jgi:hypothetical protein